METIRVELAERSYDIAIGTNVLKKIGDNLKSFDLSPRIAIVSNPTVFSLYGKPVVNAIKKAGFNAVTISIPDGEAYKDLLWLQRIYNELLTHKLDRSSALIALGGGVIGDITGFAASTYMRGIAYVQIPTTLLAQVDSSVGGKTGVNHKLGKNMIGTFWQPRLVWIDVDTLKTLPKRELVSGLAEVIKYGVIYDEDLFRTLEAKKEKILKLDRKILTHIIKRSCEIKADVVSKDERESGLRSILNFGHTIGHAIETATDYKRYLHGEAVALGMCLEAQLSQDLDFIDKKSVVRIKELVDSFGLPSALPADIDTDRMLISMQLDKKAVAGKLKFILTEKIGRVRIHKGITEKVIKQLLKSSRR
jgi:3-dehydroquinate synthase